MAREEICLDRRGTDRDMAVTKSRVGHNTRLCGARSIIETLSKSTCATVDVRTFVPHDCSLFSYPPAPARRGTALTHPRPQDRTRHPPVVIVAAKPLGLIRVGEAKLLFFLVFFWWAKRRRPKRPRPSLRVTTQHLHRCCSPAVPQVWRING